ncbi:hypothetical protein F4780DRAFT_777585 [Xylariomycetidae sp. FL0641]|nr:hypothetical protein F4780DRAFT_777585 [Xylariomycetidae sp. FL0641]
MASRSDHLDATQGREVVYCHGCHHEWYKDEQSNNLDCPRCHGEITEIVSLDNDPRVADQDDFLPAFDRQHHRYYDSESDPEEADIEDHIAHGPGGFFGHRGVFAPPRSDHEARRRPRPDNEQDISDRFSELFGAAMGGPSMYGHPEPMFRNAQDGPQRVTYQRISGPGFTGGISSFSITTGSGPQRMRHAGGPGAPPVGPDDVFHRIFETLFDNLGPPPMPGHEQAPHTAADRASRIRSMPLELSNVLEHLSGLFMSQEDFDRFVQTTADENRQSNGVPPASEDAIKNLPRKKLDEEMLGPELKGECTICMDDVKVGDEVMVLPLLRNDDDRICGNEEAIDSKPFANWVPPSNVDSPMDVTLTPLLRHRHQHNSRLG